MKKHCGIQPQMINYLTLFQFLVLMMSLLTLAMWVQSYIDPQISFLFTIFRYIVILLLFFNSRAPSPPPAKKAKVEKDTDIEELPDMLQGEIARLGHRFQVSVDSRHHSGSHAHHLVCRLGQ